MVLDPQNTALPIPVTRDVGGFQMQELQMIDYPYFIDVRALVSILTIQLHPICSQLTFPWASPITIDETKAKEKTSPDLSKVPMVLGYRLIQMLCLKLTRMV